ncbi:hypothetical protein CsatB_013122 [Cannabis sativa]
MAVELVVCPVVSASVEFLLKKITSSDVASFLRGKTSSGFDRLLDKLEITFLSLAEVLGDAEQKQIRNPRIEKWLDKLQDAVEDAEDLFEEIEYDALKLKLEMESEPDKLKVSNFFSNYNTTDEIRKSDLVKILDRLDTFSNQRYILNLTGDVEKIQSQRPPSISSINDSEFVGRDVEKINLRNMLLSDKVGSEKICVIPIVGLGGIGKTTLAQALYNDFEVDKYFELKAWVSVSDEFDVCKVTKTILVAVTRDACAVEDLCVLQEKVQEKLNKRKFLIVLDDVWNEEYDFWDTTRMLFKVGAQGSKIIVTTRSERVASMVGTTASCHLGVLKEEVCFELLFKIVSGNKEFCTTDSNLRRIGEELVRKCKGLPLAVKAVASLLRFTNVNEWKRIAENDILDLPIGEKNILPALRLSYHYLPSHLKRCFVYCSMFPKDYEFEKEELVLLWMVDNLLEHSSGNRSMKEVGYEYFDDLVCRSFFQSTSGSSKSVFTMHDLVVDLAIFVSKRKYLYVEKSKIYDTGLMRQIRHITFDKFSYLDFHEIHKLICEATSLRVFVPVSKYFITSTTTLQGVLKDFMKFRCLRFFSLVGYRNVTELPKSVGELKHLRHLDLSFTSITELPNSMCLLYNLRTLKLSECKYLVKLPKNLHHLINLRYLDMSKCRFRTLPPLGQLPALISLSIEHCEAVEMVSLDFYGTGSSNSFPLLESLTFKRLPKWKKWSTPNVNVKAFPKLKSLTIHLCESLKGDLPPLLPSLTKLHIYECPKLASSLPAMPNLHKLEDLYLKNCHHLDFLPSSIYNSLQKLDIEHISGSFKLLPLNSFPNIRIVRVCDCKNLESFSLSNNLNSLFSLSIERCARLIESRNNWNLQALPNLTSFSIGDYELDPMEIFLEQGLLPTSLTSLVIRGIAGLETLEGMWFQELESLKRLCIYDCPNLQSLPVEGLPPSRRGLLPPSFESFFMKGCPLLEAKYEWDEGNDLGWEISCISQPQVPSLNSLIHS